MTEQPDNLVYGVMVVAFVVGYLVVSFVIKHLKALNARPPMNEELWKEQEKAVTARGDGAENDAPHKSEGLIAHNSNSTKQE